MRLIIKQFVEICAHSLPIYEPIYEFGSFQVPGQKGFADLRPFFPGKKYVGADIREGEGVDVLIDICHASLSLGPESVGTVLSLDTFEHVEFLREAIKEVHRILKPEGFFILSSVMNCPLHDSHDYWRFTPEGFKSLLKPFTFSFVDFMGNPKFPATVVGIASKSLGPANFMSEFMKNFEILK